MKLLKIMCVIALVFTFSTSVYANIKLRVVAVNPSKTDTKTIPIKIYLPDEVTPGDIIDQGGLNIEFDSERSIYYVFRDEVELAPKETRLFEVEIKDIWRIPDDELSGMMRRTSRILKQLEKTEYYNQAATMGNTIFARLEEIEKGQSDETISRESHIGLYRTNVGVVERIKEDIDKLEKLLIYIGGPPAPEMLEESSLKSDAPTQTTTWLIIFIIIGFIGLLGFVFFFTWHKQAQITEKVMLNARSTSFPESGGGEKEGKEEKKEEREPGPTE